MRLKHSGQQLDAAITKVMSDYADVSDVDATPSDVRAGKHYVNSSKQLVEGTLADAEITLGAVVSSIYVEDNDSGYPILIDPTATVEKAGYVSNIPNGSYPAKYIRVEEKSVTPSEETQNITPTEGKLLKNVTVNPIPEEYIVPSGTINITENGVVDVAGYATANVYVAGSGGGGIDGGYNVTFVSGGDDYAIVSVVAGNSVTRPANPTQTGYSFTGWYTAATGGEKITFPYTPSGDTTLYAQFIEQSVIGFTGLTNGDSPTPDLVFTDDIAGVSKYTTEADGTNVIVHNDLDGYFPFSEISEYTDGDGNVFVKYPKMWIKWVLDGSGNIDGIKISNVKADDDYFIPDAFLNPAAMNTYLDYFALGKYEASGSSSKIYSKSGQTCLVNVTRGESRTAARAYGTVGDLYNGYQQIDLSMLTLYNFLCMLYYKTPNIQRVYGGRTGSETTGWSDAANTGSCDGITGLNGWDTVTDCVKMLGIENPYGNINKWIDGVFFSTGAIYAHRLPQQYADSSSNAVNLGFSRPTGVSYVSKLKKGTSDATRSFVYCSSVTDGSSTKYVGDSYSYYASGVVLYAGGRWNAASGAGLWYLNGDYSASYANSNVGGRLAYRPVNE